MEDWFKFFNLINYKRLTFEDLSKIDKYFLITDRVVNEKRKRVYRLNRLQANGENFLVPDEIFKLKKFKPNVIINWKFIDHNWYSLHDDFVINETKQILL